MSREGIPQSFPGVVVFRARFHGLEYPIAVDYSDYAGVNEDCAGLSALYFKMQFDKGGYGADHVVPGGFVPRGESIYSYIAHLRAIRDRKTFRHEVYGRFGGGFATDVRTKAVEILRNQNRFGFEGGLGTVRYSRALREVASSKVCIDLPGNGGFCFRLIDYFAVGACVISYPHPNRLPEPLVDRTHIVYCQEDMSDLAELCEHYLKNDEEREAVQQQSRAYFDAHLHRQRLAAYYLDHIVRRLEQLS